MQNIAYKGKLDPIEMEGKTLEEFCQLIAKQEGIHVIPLMFCRTWEEVVTRGLHGYFVIEGKLYKLAELNESKPDDYFEAVRCADGSIQVEMRFSGLEYTIDEAVEKALSNFK